MVATENRVPEAVGFDLAGSYSPLQVSTTLGVSSETVRRAIRAGALAAVRVGRLWRITPAALQRWVEQTVSKN